MRVVSLGSGSSGNALLVEAGPQGRTKLLVDAGLSGRILVDRLRSVGVSPAQLQAILVTHEHSDHVVGLPLVLKRYAIPLITAPGTFEAIVRGLAEGAWRADSGSLVTMDAPSSYELETTPVLLSSYQQSQVEQAGEIPGFLPLPVGSHRVIGDIEVLSFPVSHDAVSPCGYLLHAGGCRVCVAIDTGEVTPLMLEMMSHADLLVLESNHDRQMLLRGPYPYSLKQRILGATGHLSNDQAAGAVLRTWRSDSVRWLWLSHLSRTNNTPKVALNSMRAHIKAAGANLDQVHISVLPPQMGTVWDSTQLWHAPTLWEMR